MIELKNSTLVFSFPDIHPEARISIKFQRTLRIPDDEKTYPLPPGLGIFPLKHIDDYPVPEQWVEHGGVMMPMYQSEAMWIDFSTDYMIDHRTSYPFAIKIATGKINAVTGEPWDNTLNSNPQDYMVSTEQPWLDGYCIGNNVIRQFVAVPPASGYSAEEQLTGKAEHGGIQLIVYPMKKEIFYKKFPIIQRKSVINESGVRYSTSSDMLIAPGGKMEQEVFEDPFDFTDWDQNINSRCFVHIADSMVWRSITGENPPTVPFTAKEYNRHGFPWFKYYKDNSKSLPGSSILNKLKSVLQMGNDKGESPLPENTPVNQENVIIISKDQVREGHF